jgi:hypothetical protein
MKTYSRFCAPKLLGGDSLGYLGYHGNQSNHVIMVNEEIPSDLDNSDVTKIKGKILAKASELLRYAYNS